MSRSLRRSDLDPAVNSIQGMIARREGTWQIELFQNTPAAFHGRPEASAALTRELQDVAASGDLVR